MANLQRCVLPAEINGGRKRRVRRVKRRGRPIVSDAFADSDPTLFGAPSCPVSSRPCRLAPLDHVRNLYREAEALLPRDRSITRKQVRRCDARRRRAALAEAELCVRPFTRCAASTDGVVVIASLLRF